MTVADYYNEVYASRELDLDERGNDFAKIARLWKTIEGRSLTVLDLGCGAGSVTETLVDQGHTVIGFDIMEEAVRRARSRGLDARVCDLNSALPVPDRTADVVVALDIFEHVFDPTALMSEVKRVLRSDGHVIGMIPLHFDIHQRLRTLLGRGIVHYEHYLYDPGCSAWNYFHIRFLTLAEVREGLAAAGLVIDREEFRPMVSVARKPLVHRVESALRRPKVVRAWPSLLASGVVFRASTRGAGG